MASFANLNDRRSARRRYLTPRPSSDGSGISQADRQQIRWRYTGVLLTGPVIPGLITYVGTITEVSQPVMRIL